MLEIFSVLMGRIFTIPHGYKQSNVSQTQRSQTFSPYLRFCIELISYKNLQVNKINLDMKKTKENIASKRS